MKDAMADFQQIRDMLARLPQPTDEALPSGTTDEVINGAQTAMGVRFPESFREWLKISNGPCVGPGGMFGVQTQRRSLDIEELLTIYPEWRTQWIPVAGDGCGNYYVMPTATDAGIEPPVIFFDTTESTKKPAYVVASSLPHFLVFLFEEELGESYWPFRKERVLAVDPDLKPYKDVPLPWDA